MQRANKSCIITPLKLNTQTGLKMATYKECSNHHALQNHAYAVKALEVIACDDWLGGAISDDMYAEAMEATEKAVAAAVKAGVSYRDLPPV